MLLTNDHNYITAYTLQSATTPADVVIGKYFYKQHVEDITQELHEAQGLGQAAAEEWYKGLQTRGKERMKLAENWERWEVKQQWLDEHQDAKRATSVAPSVAPSVAATSHREPSRSPPRHVSSPVIHAPVPASKYAPAVSFAAQRGGSSPCFNNTPAVPNLTAVAPSYYHAQARPPTVPPQIPTPQPTGSTAPGGKNLHDANEAKATRRSDIERRCQQMDPSVPPNILRHMDSFKAAIQISQPMTDHAWNVLQPRLLAQLPAAQQAEADHVSRVASLPTRTTERRHQDVNSKEAKEAMDREWEESQRPIRDTLDAIADDFIAQDWDHGHAVTHDNSPKFAADLLAHVRRTYYAHSFQTAALASEKHGHESTDNAENKPKLVLDNLKWVYDNKVKLLTEQFRKDIFLCYGNGCETNTRFYGFEGVIQHYGAKHTNTFSVGNVVVAWREAEWPEETPFHPDPISVKHTYHTSTSSVGHIGYHSGFSRAGTSTPHMQPHLPQASPGPYNYGGQYNGPFPVPQPPLAGLPGYGYPQPFTTPADGYPHQAMGPPVYGSQPPQHSYMPSPAMINPAIAPPPPTLPPGHAAAETLTGGTADPGHSTSSYDKQVSTIIGLTQDIWKRTSGIKDMPNSLRIYIMLHRVISKFHVEFNHEPNLNHFIDALSNHEMPRALKNASGLSCKACQVQSSHQLAAAYYAKSEERKTYIVLALLSHFRTQHLPIQPLGPIHGQVALPLDWKEDMIELPNERFISGLIHAPGIDDEKLLLIATVFPNHFPTPLPKIGVIDNHGVVSPASSGPKELADNHGTTDTSEVSGKAIVPTPESASKEPSLPPRETADEYDPLQPSLTAEANDHPGSRSRKRYYEDSSPSEHRQRYAGEPRYYVGRSQTPTEHIFGTNVRVYQMPRERMDDGYPRSGQYVEYAPSPRMVHAGPAYDEYTGRRSVFREQERFYGPPPEQVVYSHGREGSNGSGKYGSYPRQVRFYEEEDPQPEYHYLDEPQSREASPRRGQTAADRFLEEFVPGKISTTEAPQPLAQPLPEAKSIVPKQKDEDDLHYTPSPSNAPIPGESSTQARPLAVPHPRAPSTVSNGSRYEDYHHNSHLMPAPDTGGPSRRVGPQRRRDRPHEQRMPSRFYRYMSVARDDRGSSMSRSQSRRYDEQRRRIDQQETPQPGGRPEYEPTYSRDPSVDRPLPEHSFQQPARLLPQEYISVQDRPQYSPPRHRYDEYRGPQTMYVDEWGHPVHDYEFVRVHGNPRQARGPYMSHQPPRYEQDHYQYVSVPYERPQPQRFNTRSEQYMYYEERDRPPPRRVVPESDNDFPEPPPPEIKVEGVSVPMPEAT